MVRIVAKYQKVLVNLLANSNAVGAHDYKDLRDGLNSASVSALVTLVPILLVLMKNIKLQYLQMIHTNLLSEGNLEKQI